MKYTNEQFRAIYRSLPSDIKEVISSVECTDKIQVIGKKYKLLIDKVGILSEETGFVLRGITKPQDFVNNIQNRLEVSRDVAVGIAEEINAQIFYELRESLKQILSKKTENFENEKEENLNREDILREIEDKEHHTPPMVAIKPELYLAVKQPDEIMIPTENTHLETKRPSEVVEIITPAEQAQKKDSASQTDIHLETKHPSPQSSPNNIIKDKMSGIVNIPKETIVIKDPPSPLKATQPNTGDKIDQYREQVG